jgi:hypothetical protein
MLKSSGNKPNLLKQSEYYVRERMGDPPPGGIDYSSANKHDQPYEMLLARYENDFGMSIPYTKKYVKAYNRPEGIGDGHFVGWGTLTYA